MTRLRDLIDEKGLLQKDVAEDLGYPRTTFNNYVCGFRELDHEGIIRVCDYFGCTADYLLGRTDNRLPAVSDDDASLIAAYHALPLEIRRAVDGLMAPYREKAEGKNAG